jgi:hypothetical protein
MAGEHLQADNTGEPLAPDADDLLDLPGIRGETRVQAVEQRDAQPAEGAIRIFDPM